jgi:hypothetical protein
MSRRENGFRIRQMLTMELLDLMPKIIGSLRGDLLNIRKHYQKVAHSIFMEEVKGAFPFSG